MKNFYDKLKEYLENTPQDVILSDWAKSASDDAVGPTFEEFFENSIKYEMYNNIPKQGYQQFLANDLDPKFSSGFFLINKSTIKCKMHLFR